jgi:hypothetical protein
VPKKLMAITILTAILVLVISVQVVEVVNANPFHPIPTSPPDTAVVSLKVLCPKENASYTNGTINLCFIKEINSISGVSTWVNVVSTYQGDWMNSSKWCPFPPSEEGKNWNDFQVLLHNFTLTQIPKGYHTLTIDARGEGSYNANGSSYSFNLPKKTVIISFFMDSSPVNGSQTINQIPSPTPTANTLIPTPTGIEVDASDSSILNQTTLTAIVIVIVLVAVASISLVYFKRRKGKP